MKAQMKKSITALAFGAALAVSGVSAYAQHPENNEAHPAANMAPHAAETHDSAEPHTEGHEHAPGHGEHAHGAHEGFHQPSAMNWFNPSPPAEVTVHDGHELSQPGPPPFVGPLINFGILVVLGYMAVRRSINPALAARRAAIETELAEASRLRAEAEAMNQEFTAKLAGLDADVERLKAEFTRAGEIERDRIVAEAKAKAERMREDGVRMVQSELNVLRETLRQEAVLAAATAAEETVRKSINAADQSRLADDFLASLERTSPESKGVQA